MNEFLKRFALFPTRLFLVVIGAALFIPFIGNAHLFDWDEINFAESAREMLLTGNYHQAQINFQPFFEKPPLFMWMQAFCMSRFGVTEFAARLPNAIFGILTMLLVFNVGKKYFSSTFGVFWGLLMACSFLPFFYFKSGIIDPVFNYFIFLSIYWLFRVSVKDEFEPGKVRAKNMKWFTIYSAIACGLAVLTKGPVAVLIIVLVVSIVLFWNRGRLTFNISSFFIWSLIVTVIICLWLSYESNDIGVQFLKEFLSYQVRLFTTPDAGHGGPIFYHPLVLLLGCFPASILLFGALKKSGEDTLHQVLLKRWMLALLLVVLILFSLTKTKIVHYSSLCYLPITFLAAYYLNKIYEGSKRWSAWMSVGIVLLGFAWGGAVLAVMYVFSMQVPFPEIADTFVTEALKAPIYWNAKEMVVPIVFLVLLIISIVLFHLKKSAAAIGTLLISCGLFAACILLLIVPRVERFSQHSMIDFLEKTSVEHASYEARGFKSYATYFYGQVSPQSTSNKTYVISKVNLIARIDTIDLNLLYAKNGFVFFVKK